MASDAQKVIATAGIISVGVGSANSILKYKRTPSYRFLVGSGVAYLLLSAMGNSAAMAEVAKGLALGIMTTVLLGDGGGLLTYIAGEKETNTTKARILASAPSTPPQPRIVRNLVLDPRGGYRSDYVTPTPGVPPTTNR